jgi:hypothetical protein
MELGDGRRDVVDPEVRAYVSSLVTAVRISNPVLFAFLTRFSLEEVVQTKMADMSLEMMLWHVFGI